MSDRQKIPFAVVEHEADIGLEIYGRDTADLFRHGGLALFSIITDRTTTEARVTRRVVVKNDEISLVVFLNELLYLWDTERFIPCIFSTLEKGETIEVDIAGAVFSPEEQTVYREVKAVTYHQFSIRHEGNLLKATVFLDV